MGPSPRAAGFLFAVLCSVAAFGDVKPPPLQAERVGVARMPARTPHWIYIYDVAELNETDARIYVYDGDAHRELGQIDAGFWPAFAVSPDGRTSAVATTYFARGSHGTRTDVIEFTDNATLDVTGEIVVSSKRAQGPMTPYSLSYSADQRLMYLPNLTPAASLTVIDAVKRAVLGEIEMDGCVLAIPSLQRRFSALCENGRLLSVVVDDAGKEVSRSLTAPFFSVDRDPIFAQGIPTPVGVTFLSFLGDVYPVDLTASEPKPAAPWAMVTAAERGKWRPGGTQVGAYQKLTGRLYVPMHQGGPGSHKIGGREVWVFDSAQHRRIARWPVDVAKYGAVNAVQVSQDDKPLLYLLTENSGLLIMDATTGRLLHAEAKIGQTPWYLINP